MDDKTKNKIAKYIEGVFLKPSMERPGDEARRLEEVAKKQKSIAAALGARTISQAQALYALGLTTIETETETRQTVLRDCMQRALVVKRRGHVLWANASLHADLTERLCASRNSERAFSTEGFSVLLWPCLPLSGDLLVQNGQSNWGRSLAMRGANSLTSLQTSGAKRPGARVALSRLRLMVEFAEDIVKVRLMQDSRDAAGSMVRMNTLEGLVMSTFELRHRCSYGYPVLFGGLARISGFTVACQVKIVP